MKSPAELQAYPCDLCGSNSSRRIFTKAGALIRRPFAIVQCRNCGHVFVSPRVPDEMIPALYDADYYAGRGFDKTLNYEVAAQESRESPIAQPVSEIARQLFATDVVPRTLDLGCGLGDLVLGLRQRGFESYGVDDSPFAARFLHERGVPTLPDFQKHPEQYFSSFDLVTCIEVIEHVISPTSFLQFVRQMLRPGGYLIILTGNWHVQRMRPGTPYLMPEGHIHYFTPASLARFFQKVQLQPIQIARNEVWYANRMLPTSLAPIKPGLQRLVQRFAPEYGPFPIARRNE